MKNTFLLYWTGERHPQISRFKLEFNTASFKYEDIDVFMSITGDLLKVTCENNICDFERCWKTNTSEEIIKEEIDLFLKNCSSKLR